MQTPEIVQRIQQGEDSTTQFKADVTDANRLAEEFVAFSNAQGGLLLIGVADEEMLLSSQPGDINPEAVYAFLEQDNPNIADELRQGELQLLTVSASVLTKVLMHKPDWRLMNVSSVSYW